MYIKYLTLIKNKNKWVGPVSFTALHVHYKHTHMQTRGESLNLRTGFVPFSEPGWDCLHQVQVMRMQLVRLDVSRSGGRAGNHLPHSRDKVTVAYVAGLLRVPALHTPRMQQRKGWQNVTAWKGGRKNLLKKQNKQK